MSFAPIPHQVNAEHLSTLSTPELVAIRVEMHEENTHIAGRVVEASRVSREIAFTESPARESAADALSDAHGAYNLHIRNILSVDETLRSRNDHHRLKALMATALRGSVACEYYNEHDRSEIFTQIMTDESLHPAKRSRLLGLLFPRSALESDNNNGEN